MKTMSKEVKKLLPTDDAFQAWQEIIFFTSGIKFTKDVVIAAYFLDVGYRGGMNKFSQFSFTESKEDPWNTSVNPYLDGDNWTDTLDTDVLDSLLDKCCLIQLGMEHPKFGDSKEYKEKFNAALTTYNSALDKMGIDLIETKSPFEENEDTN
jgi:hypothetical protein